MSSLHTLEEIRAEFRAMKKTKLGLHGNRDLMDSGWKNATYPPHTFFESFNANNVPAEWVYQNPPEINHKILLHCHGGGYNVGSTLSHRPLAAQLAKVTGARVVTFNFRLAPENKFPCALDDALSVYEYLLSKYDSNDIVITGDSGGGSLAFALALKIRDLGLPRAAAIVGLSAWVDFACEGNTFDENKPKDPAGNRGGLLMMATAYAGKDNLKNPLVSPLYAESLAGLPPILLQVGTAETLLDDSRRLAAKAQQDGVDVTLQEWPDMIHVWHCFYSRLPEARAALNAIGSWLVTKIGA